MKPNKWHIYDKHGSSLNLHADSYLNLIFSTDSGKDATGYAITDPSAIIIDTVITNGGWNYVTPTQVYIDYVFDEFGAFAVDASITYKDVSVFSPELQNSPSVSIVTIDDSTNYIYPSVTYAGAIFLDPVSQGLIETEHLTILEETSIGFVSPYDSSNSILTFKMVGDEDVIKFFSIDEASQEVVWADELIYDVSQYIINQGIQLNIGFRSDEEGVYERRMVAYHTIGEINYPLLEIVVNAQSIGQDERFDTLLDNFGLYKPKSIPQLFKEADINEALPDWKLLNYKAKHMILEHSNIMPYIGTYKGLINAIKWLGYEDIHIKEWFKDVKENKKISLYVPYDAEGRKKTIKYFTPDERKNLKKLNQLSLVYCITRETGEVDEWGNPTTEKCYQYNLNEILIKLFALKVWLEKNIIGVNTRIFDLTGEAIYFERFGNLIYGTQNIGTVAVYEESLTPITIEESSELVSGDTSISLTLKEYNEVTAETLTGNALDLARYGWDPSNGFFSPEDYFNLGYIDPSAVFIGSPFMMPFTDLYDLQWKLQVEKEYGVVTSSFVTNPLFVYENEIKFYNVFDTSSLFLDISANVDVTLETAYLRDPAIDMWPDSIAYSIYQDVDASGNNTGKWVFESSMGTLSYTWGEFSLQTSSTPKLVYALDENYKAPLLYISGYKWTDSSGISHDLNKEYYLDILDGKISMDSSTIAPNGDTIDVENTINFNYDTSLGEQKITLNVAYITPRMPVFSFDPSDVSLLYYNPDASVDLIEDNSIYHINVNHAGNYDIKIYGWNGQNNLFFNYDRDGYSVWQKHQTINSYIDTSCAGNIEQSCTSSYLSIQEVSTLVYDSQNPIFDRIVPMYGLTLEYDGQNKPYIKVPSISYFQDAPQKGSMCNFFNLTERVLTISGTNITVDEDFQTFLLGDSVSLVKFDKGKYSFLKETSAYVTSAASPNFTLDTAPLDFVADPSYEWYLINTTLRPFVDASNNNINMTFKGYTFYPFKETQLVNVIINDASSGYSWGAAFRVLDVSTTYDPFLGYQHTFDGNLPELIFADPSQYSLEIKHAFTSFSEMQIDVSTSIEVNNEFNIYLDDTYFEQYSLDNTFTIINIDFDRERVLEQWYDASDNMINKEFYPFDHSIKLDVSTLVILKASYDSSSYMINQQNIWEIKKHDGEKIMRVNNYIVPFIFDEIGTYDIKCQSYDSYGNLKEKSFDGLIVIS